MTYAQLTVIAEAARKAVPRDSHGVTGISPKAVAQAVYNAVMEEGEQFVKPLDRSAHSHYSKKERDA